VRDGQTRNHITDGYPADRLRCLDSTGLIDTCDDDTNVASLLIEDSVLIRGEDELATWSGNHVERARLVALVCEVQVRCALQEI
jgi:hypothetical protein